MYCQGWNEPNCFLLIAMLAPDAHEQARHRTIMHNWGLIAEKFRQHFENILSQNVTKGWL
ncbi:type II toxin-antitoxin system YafO family toxin [Vibrio cyclitrophicus]